MDKTSKPKKISLIGPPCVGKGFLSRYAKEHYQFLGNEVHTIGMGDLVRARLDNDMEFANKYRKPMADGYLLPDNEMRPMFQKAWNEAIHPHLIQEGYLRTTRQVTHGEKMGFLQEDSVTIILLASKTTCHNRALDRLRRKPNGNRLDEAKFQDRFDHDNQTLPDIRKALLRTRTTVVQLDANDDLESRVFPDFLSILQAHWNEVTPFERPNIPERLLRPKTSFISFSTQEQNRAASPA